MWQSIVNVHDDKDGEGKGERSHIGRYLTAKVNIPTHQIILTMPFMKEVKGLKHIDMVQKSIPIHDAMIFMNERLTHVVYNPNLKNIENTLQLIESNNVWYLLNHDVHPNTKLIAIRDGYGKLQTIGWKTVHPIEKNEILTFDYGQPSLDWKCICTF